MGAIRKLKAQILELNQIPAKELDQNCIAVLENFEPEDVLRLAFNRGARHIVQKSSRSFDQELLVSETMIRRPKEFLADPLKFILGQEMIRTFQFDCAAIDHKKVPLEELEKFISAVPGAKSIVQNVVSSAEEIFTNASKNTGSFYKVLGDADSQKPAKGGSIRLLAGATESILVVGCIDSFGVLDIENVIEKILNCYMHGIENSINRGSGGAGIGSFLIYNSAMNLYIAVEKNKRTAVFCAYPLGMRTKDSEGLPKNLHLVSI